MMRTRLTVRLKQVLAMSLAATMVMGCAKSQDSASPIPLQTSVSDESDAAAKSEMLAQTAAIQAPLQSRSDQPAKGDKPVIVLVPGFFNSITPSHYSKDGWISYWSAAVINTIARRGFTVVMADKLAPIGTVAENGEVLHQFLKATAKRFEGRKLTLIAHSAGGLYTMYALSKEPTLPVKTVITIATPYQGVQFVENLAANVPGVDQLAQWLDLEGIREFRPSIVARALQDLSVPPGVRWIAVGGTQKPCFLFTCSDSRYLSWLLSIAQRLMTESSDGVVTLSSALGLSTELQRPDGTHAPMERWADFSFDLEHWKMVEEADLFVALGIVDIGRIRSEQRRYFGEIMDRLMIDPIPPNPEAPH